VLGWIRERRLRDRNVVIKQTLFDHALKALAGGSRFQFRVEAIGGEDQLKRFIVKLSMSFGANVRANCGQGLVTLYDDSRPDGTSVVVATINKSRTI